MPDESRQEVTIITPYTVTNLAVIVRVEYARPLMIRFGEYLETCMISAAFHSSIPFVIAV